MTVDPIPSRSDGATEGRSAVSQPSRAVAHALASIAWPTEILALGGLSAVYFLVYSLNVESLFRAMNIAGPITLGLILGLACLRMARRSPITIWASLFWFRLACMAYFGIGALAAHIGSDTTKLYIFAVYNFTERTNLKVNIIVSAGIFLVALFSYVALLVIRRTRSFNRYDTGVKSGLPTANFAIAFLAIGAAIKYLIVLPYFLGLTNLVLPGYLISISNIFYVGVYLAVYLAMRKSSFFLYVSIVVGAVDTVISLASFSKTDLLLLIIFAALGIISKRVSLRAVFPLAIIVAVAYAMFQPLVFYGRDSIYSRYGEIRGAGLAERIEIIGDYLRYGAPTERDTLAFGRLSYVTVNAFVIDRYDAGAPGSTLIDAAAVFVPRALWPDKPIITRLGEEVSFMMVGHDGNSVAIGHFAEAYWNFGWWGIVPYMAVLSVILAMFSEFSLGVMARKDWLFLPVVFIGVNLGIRVDGFFVSDVLGQVWMALILGFFIWSIRSLLPAAAMSLRRNVPISRGRYRPGR